MIYRLLLDLALTVRSTPVLSFAVCFSRRQKRGGGGLGGDADTGSYAYIRGGVGHPERKRSFLGKA